MKKVCLLLAFILAFIKINGQSILATDSQGRSLSVDVTNVYYMIKNKGGTGSYIIFKDRAETYFTAYSLAEVQSLACRKFYLFTLARTAVSIVRNDSILLSIANTEIKQTSGGLAIIVSTLKGTSFYTNQTYSAILTQANATCGEGGSSVTDGSTIVGTGEAGSPLKINTNGVVLSNLSNGVKDTINALKEIINAPYYPLKAQLDSIKVGGKLFGTTTNKLGTKVTSTLVEIERIDTSGFPAVTQTYDGVTYDYTKATLRNNNIEFIINPATNKWTPKPNQKLASLVSFPTENTRLELSGARFIHTLDTAEYTGRYSGNTFIWERKEPLRGVYGATSRDSVVSAVTFRRNTLADTTLNYKKKELILTYNEAQGKFTSEKVLYVDDFGGKDSIAFERCKAFQDDINLIENTIYTVGILYLHDGKRLNGNNAIINQASTLTANNPIIWVTGDNVKIENVTLYGQIAAHTSEFSHGISIQRYNTIYANVQQNVEVNNVKIYNVRGDGVAVGYSAAPNKYAPNNITLKNITTRNCYRNGVALISGRGVTIDNIIADSCGLWGLDLETDAITDTLDNVNVTNIKCANIGIVGFSGGYMEAVTIDGFEINPKNYKLDASVTYAAGATSRTYGMSIKEAKGVLRNGKIHNTQNLSLIFAAGTTSYTDFTIEKVEFDSVLNNAGGSMITINNPTGNNLKNVVFDNCKFYGRGLVRYFMEASDSVTIKNSEIKDFRHYFTRAARVINCDINTSVANPAVGYVMNGVLTLEDCKVTIGNAAYLLFNNEGSAQKHRIKNLRLNQGVLATSMVNSKLILEGFTEIGGLRYYNANSGGTINNTQILKTSTTAQTLTAPSYLITPENVFDLVDTTGSTITIGTKLVSGKNRKIYNDGTNLIYSASDLVQTTATTTIPAATTIAAGATSTFTVTVTGATTADFAQVSIPFTSAELQQVIVSVSFTAADTATVAIYNRSGTSIDVSNKIITVKKL